MMLMKILQNTTTTTTGWLQVMILIHSTPTKTNLYTIKKKLGYLLNAFNAMCLELDSIA